MGKVRILLILFLSCTGMQGESLEQLYRLSKETVEAFGDVLPAGDQVINQLYFTVVVESGGGHYREQLSGGPAVSFWQIEPVTAEDIYYRYLKDRPRYKRCLEEYSGVTNVPRGTIRDVLLQNDRFAAGLARLVYAMDRGSIPEGSWEAHALYWKSAYQKGGSKGLSANKAFRVFIGHTNQKP